MGLLIDTSILVAIERSGLPPDSLFRAIVEESVAISAITASELLHGIHRADGAVRREKRERFVEAIFGAMPVLPFTLEVARIHSRIWVDLQRRGEMIGGHDLIIAATALAHEMSVLTRNQRHFGRIETLKVASW